MAKTKFDDLLSQNIAREQNAQKPPAARVQNSALATNAASQQNSLQWIDEELIEDNPFQPRLRMSETALRQLMQSLNEHGQLQAARVRPHPSKTGRFQLIFGHRRHQAVRRGANAGSQQSQPTKFLGQLRCEVTAASDEQMLEAAYAENEDREEFSVFDRAQYFQTLRVFYSFAAPENAGQNGELSPGTIDQIAAQNTPENSAQNASLMSWEELAKTRSLPLSPRAMRRLVQVLELPSNVRDALANVNLGSEERPQNANEKHCRALLLLQNRATQDQLLHEIIDEQLSGNQALRRAEQLSAMSRPTSSDSKDSAPQNQQKSTAANAAHTTQNASEEAEIWQRWLQKRLRPTLKQLEKSLATPPQNSKNLRQQQEKIAAQLEALANEIRAQNATNSSQNQRQNL